MFSSVSVKNTSVSSSELYSPFECSHQVDNQQCPDAHHLCSAVETQFWIHYITSDSWSILSRLKVTLVNRLEVPERILGFYKSAVAALFIARTPPHNRQHTCMQLPAQLHVNCLWLTDEHTASVVQPLILMYCNNWSSNFTYNYVENKLQV